MNLKPLGTNKTELRLNETTRVLFSYETPVAYTKLTECGMKYYMTNEYYSRTTTKHIKSWMPLEDAESVNQSVIDELVK